jgi:hypothetical protein
LESTNEGEDEVITTKRKLLMMNYVDNEGEDDETVSTMKIQYYQMRTELEAHVRIR